MRHTWTTTIEVDFPIEEADIKPIFDDDTVIDYMGRAHSRLVRFMEKLKKSGEISHFRVREVPHLHPPGVE